MTERIGIKVERNTEEKVGSEKGDLGPFVEKAAQITVLGCVCKGWLAIAVGKQEGDKLGCHLCGGHLTENTCPWSQGTWPRNLQRDLLAMGRGACRGPNLGTSPKSARERELGITAQ